LALAYNYQAKALALACPVTSPVAQLPLFLFLLLHFSDGVQRRIQRNELLSYFYLCIFLIFVQRRIKRIELFLIFIRIKTRCRYSY